MTTYLCLINSENSTEKSHWFWEKFRLSFCRNSYSSKYATVIFLRTFFFQCFGKLYWDLAHCNCCSFSYPENILTEHYIHTEHVHFLFSSTRILTAFGQVFGEVRNIGLCECAFFWFQHKMTPTDTSYDSYGMCSFSCSLCISFSRSTNGVLPFSNSSM